MKVNYRDLIERVGWSTIYALLAAVLTVLTSEGMGWEEAAKFIGITLVTALIKVISAQQVGSSGTGDAIPGGVKDTP